MHKLGEQWVENGRMYKAVLQESKIINRTIDGNICHGCCHVDNWDDDCLHPSKLCPLDKGLIVHDLGPVNEDGCLESPIGKGFPTIRQNSDKTWVVFWTDSKNVRIFSVGATEQEAIDAWNRRA